MISYSEIFRAICEWNRYPIWRKFSSRTEEKFSGKKLSRVSREKDFAFSINKLGALIVIYRQIRRASSHALDFIDLNS